MKDLLSWQKGRVMNKVTSSNGLNRWTGGKELLFCTRVHYNTKVYGGFWIALRIIIDTSFYTLRNESEHCRRCATWEYRNGKKGKKKE